VKLYKEKYLVWFHYMFCPKCQWHDDAWMDTENDSEMKIFGSFKRIGKFNRTEPLFIGTNDEPLYDDRMKKDAKGDKITHAYILCLLDYNFKVLNNAFLVHKGIKMKNDSSAKLLRLQRIGSIKMKTELFGEINKIYGARKGCTI
jgi:beta-1,4-glucuronyltransferase 1